MHRCAGDPTRSYEVTKLGANTLSVGSGMGRKTTRSFNKGSSNYTLAKTVKCPSMGIWDGEGLLDRGSWEVKLGFLIDYKLNI